MGPRRWKDAGIYEYVTGPGPLHVLRDRQQVAVGVLEPGHLVARRSGPDAESVLLEEAKALEMHAALIEQRDGRRDIGHVPAEEGERKRFEFGHLRHSDHDAVGVEDTGEAVVVDEAQAEHPFVERSGGIVVGDGDEGDEVCRAEHAYNI